MAHFTALTNCTIQGKKYRKGDHVILHPHLARPLIGKWLERSEPPAPGLRNIADMRKDDIIAELKERKVSFPSKAKKAELAKLLAEAKAAQA